MANPDVMAEIQALNDLIRELNEVRAHHPGIAQSHRVWRSQLDHIAALATSLSSSSNEEVHQLAIMCLVLAQSFGRLLTSNPQPPGAGESAQEQRPN